jgi:hypothetical protein
MREQAATTKELTDPFLSHPPAHLRLHPTPALLIVAIGKGDGGYERGAMYTMESANFLLEFVSRIKHFLGALWTKKVLSDELQRCG